MMNKKIGRQKKQQKLLIWRAESNVSIIDLHNTIIELQIVVTTLHVS